MIKEQYLQNDDFFFRVLKGIKPREVNEVKKAVRFECRDFFKTENFFYAYRYEKEVLILYAVSAKRSWLKGKYPLLLHLKQGKKYAVLIGQMYYNIDYTEKQPKIIVSPTVIDEYKSIEERDLINPTWKLKWGLDRREYTFIVYILLSLVVLFSLLNVTTRIVYVQEKNNAEKRVVFLTQQREKALQKERESVGNLTEIISVVNRTVQQKIRRKAYIETVEIKPDANKVIFKIKCNTPEDSLDFGVLLPEESEKDKKDRKIKKVKAYKYEVSF